MSRHFPKEARDRIAKLRQTIDHLRYLYHVLDREELPEAALDSLKHELVELEKEYPELVTPDSPSQRIGGKPLPEFVKVPHKVPQWSFNDAFSEEEIRDFDTRVKRMLSQRSDLKSGKRSDLVPTYTLEHKIDG